MKSYAFKRLGMKFAFITCRINNIQKVAAWHGMYFKMYSFPVQFIKVYNNFKNIDPINSLVL